MKSMLSVLVIALILSGCNGSSGGGSATSDTPAASGGASGGGAATGGNGNASFYAIDSTGALNEDVSVPAGALEIPSKFYVMANDGSVSQLIEAGVYSPTCLLGASYADYTMVLLNKGNTTSSTTISVRVTSAGVTTGVDAYDETAFFKTRYGTNVDVTGTCTNGKMTLTGGDIIFSNGEVAVYKKGSSVYFGLSSSVAVSNVNNVIGVADFNTNYASVYYNNAGTEHLDSTMNFQPDATASKYTMAGITTPLATINGFSKYVMTNNTLTFASISVLMKKAGQPTYIGVHGLVSGKHVSILSAFGTGLGSAIAAQNANLGDQSAGTNYSTEIGSQAVHITAEQ